MNLKFRMAHYLYVNEGNLALTWTFSLKMWVYIFRIKTIVCQIAFFKYCLKAEWLDYDP